MNPLSGKSSIPTCDGCRHHGLFLGPIILIARNGAKAKNLSLTLPTVIRLQLRIELKNMKHDTEARAI